MSPNGEFFVREKINDEQAATSGLLYKVVFNENNLLDSITAVYNDTPINVNLQTTLYRKLVHGDSSLAQIAVEYQDGYIKYSSKDANMKSVESFVGAASVRFKIDEKTKKAKVAFLYDKEGKALDYNEYGEHHQKNGSTYFYLRRQGAFKQSGVCR